MSNRRKKILLLTLGVFALLGGIFLPRPSGLISILTKLYRIKQHQQELIRLRAKADTLEHKIKLWQNPGYVKKVIQTVFEKDTLSQPDTAR
ncbi:MAG: hypothetical protein ACUVUD_01195 [bacterium]